MQSLAVNLPLFLPDSLSSLAVFACGLVVISKNSLISVDSL